MYYWVDKIFLGNSEKGKQHQQRQSLFPFLYPFLPGSVLPHGIFMRCLCCPWVPPTQRQVPATTGVTKPRAVLLLWTSQVSRVLRTAFQACNAYITESITGAPHQVLASRHMDLKCPEMSASRVLNTVTICFFSDVEIGTEPLRTSYWKALQSRLCKVHGLVSHGESVSQSVRCFVCLVCFVICLFVFLNAVLSPPVFICSVESYGKC